MNHNEKQVKSALVSSSYVSRVHNSDVSKGLIDDHILTRLAWYNAMKSAGWPRPHISLSLRGQRCNMGPVEEDSINRAP